jgi:hypothetical protein
LLVADINLCLTAHSPGALAYPPFNYLRKLPQCCTHGIAVTLIRKTHLITNPIEARDSESAIVSWFDSCQATSSLLFSRGSCESSPTPQTLKLTINKANLQNQSSRYKKKRQKCNVTSPATASEGIRMIATHHVL